MTPSQHLGHVEQAVRFIDDAIEEIGSDYEDSPHSTIVVRLDCAKLALRDFVTAVKE